MLSLSSCDFRKEFFPGSQISVSKEVFLGKVFWALGSCHVQVLWTLPIHRANVDSESSSPPVYTI